MGAHLSACPDRTPRGWPAAGLLAALLVLGPGCGQADPGGASPRGAAPTLATPWSVVLAQAPRGGVPDLADPASFRAPYPTGTQVILWHPARSPRVLSAGLEAAGPLDLSPAGTHVLLCGRTDPDAAWRIWEAPLAGGAVVPVSPEDGNATGAAYLPGGRVVFSSDLGSGRDPTAAFSLHTCRRDGRERTRITFNPYSDIDPTVLADGRILYTAWQPPGDGRLTGAWALFTVRNDGTGVFAFHGSHGSAAWKRRPVQVGRRVAFLAADRQGEEVRALTVALARPLHSLREVAPGAHAAYRSASAWDDDTVLASLRLPASGGGSARSFGLFLVDATGTGAPRPFLDDPDLDEIDALPVRPRPTARGHVSSVDPTATVGELLCVDARRTDRVVTAAHRAAKLLVYQGLTTDLSAGGAASGPFVPGGQGVIPSVLLAELPLEADGSVFFEVPADTPLRFQTVDADGHAVLDSHGWVWVRPGERRGCIGCHEDRETAPPNRSPEALAAGPRTVGPLSALAGSR